MPALAPLASTSDYEARYGPIEAGRSQPVAKLLDDASSRAREIARLTISRVVDDELSIVVERSCGRLLLPEFPVVEVSSVDVDDVPLTVLTDVRSWEWGALDHRVGIFGEGQVVNIVYTHGWDPVQDWVKGIVCAAVNRADRAPGLGFAVEEELGDQSVRYPAALAIGGIWYPSSDEKQLRSLKGPIIR